MVLTLQPIFNSNVYSNIYKKIMNALLISYTTVDFQTKNQLELFVRRWDEKKDYWLETAYLMRKST